MDAAKALGCETAARLLEQYGPGAEMVTVRIEGMTQEAFDNFDGWTVPGLFPMKATVPTTGVEVVVSTRRPEWVS